MLLTGVLGLVDTTTAQQTIDPNNYRVPIIGSGSITQIGKECPGHVGASAGTYLDISPRIQHNDLGMPIYSSSDGTVVIAGNLGGDFGNLVEIDAGPIRFRYMHLAAVYVHPGKSVQVGTLIGLLGSTGASDWAHLHWEAVPESPSTVFSIYDIPGVELFSDPPTCLEDTNDGEVNGPNISTNPYNSCPEVYNQYGEDLVLFDNVNCTGNMYTLGFPNGAAGYFEYVLPQVLYNRIRSLHVPNFEALESPFVPITGQPRSIYVSADANSIAHPGRCISGDMWNLDVDLYDDGSTRIGFQSNGSPLTTQSVRNMISVIAVFDNDNCMVDQDTSYSSLYPQSGMTSWDEIFGIGGYVYDLEPQTPDWLLSLSTSLNEYNEVRVCVEVLDTPDHNRIRVLYDGNVIGESYEINSCHLIYPQDYSLGNHPLRVERTITADGLSWANADVYEETFELRDWVPPTTIATFNPPDGNNGWHVNPVTVTLSATDNVGVEQTYYSINDGGFVPGTSLTLTVDGIYEIDFYSVDVNSNIEDTKTVTIFLDQTPPETSGSVTGPRDINGIFRDNVLGEVISTDNLSGVEVTECSGDNGTSWAPLTNPQFWLNGNGIYQFFCRARDVAGNQGATLDSGPIIINMYTIFSRNPVDGFYMDANSGVTIGGDIYSEGPILLTRNTNVSLPGNIETPSGSFTNESSNTGLSFGLVNTMAPQVPAINYPFAYYWQRCDQVYSDGLVMNDVGQTMTGVICVQGNLEMYVVNIVGDVTFVVNGHILMDPTVSSFFNNDPSNGIVMYATGDIMLQGTASEYLGLVYANGDVIVRNTGMMHQGSYIADQVIFDAATNVNISYNAGFAASTFALPVSNASFADAMGMYQGPPVAPLPPQPWVYPEPEPTPDPNVLPYCSISYDWDGDDEVDIDFSWSNGFDQNHAGSWGDGSGFQSSAGVADSDSDDHVYDVENPAGYLVFTISLTINGPGGSYTCSTVIDFADNSDWMDEFGPPITNTPTPTASATPTATGVPPTETPIPSVDPTETPSPEPGTSVPSATATAVPPTLTQTPLPTATATAPPTATATATATATPPPSATPTLTATPAPTATPPPPTATPAAPMPYCTISYEWDNEEEVDIEFTWSNGFDQRHTGYWGDGSTFTTSRDDADTDTDDHEYNVDDPGDTLVYTISLIINGPGGSYTCSVTIDFSTNPDWVDEYGG